MTRPAALLTLALLCWPATAQAIPRFAARTGGDCVQCHVNPSGGGIRNAFGRNVFAQSWLPLRLAAPAADLEPSEQDLEEIAASIVEGSQDRAPFSGDVADWLAVGGDVRAAYLWARPDRALAAGEDPEVTGSFFLMEAYLYVGARLGPSFDLVLQLGPYGGFEAWMLWRAAPEESLWNLRVKIGRFMPAFGLRDPNHQLYTREAIGLGNADRDTGLEVTGTLGPAMLQLSLVNGTLGDLAFDSHGEERRFFEKAIYGRLSLRHDFGWARAQIGLSASHNVNLDQTAPLITQALPRTLASEPATGLDETRLGGFLMASAGRFTYLGELVAVHDSTYSPDLPSLSGYASSQELSFAVLQGLDVMATLEFMDPNIEVADNPFVRAGLAVELFPWPFAELRLMVRRLWTDVPATGGSWDLAVLAHAFM